jgi:putative PEP-CTERM system TPR-repeat lipoprotein
MNHVEPLLRPLAVAALSALLLAGCGKDKPEALAESAKEFIAKKDYKAATIQLRNALQQQPENGQARLLLGRVMLATGDYANAEKELRKALEYRVSPDVVYPELLKAMLRQGDPKKVVTEFAGKHLSDPAAEAAFQSDVGMAYMGLGQGDEAKAAFDAALKAKPGFALARIGEAMLMAQARDLDGAARVVDEVLAQNPGLPEALTLKADLALAKADTDTAVKLYDEAVRAQPTNLQARMAMATLLIRQRKFDQAQIAIADMKKAAPKDVRVSYLEGLLAYGQGDAKKTRDAALQVLKVAPNHVPSLYLAGAADLQLGAPESAVEHLRKVVAAAPRNTDARRMLTMALLRAGQAEKARDVLEPALKEAPKDPRLLQLAGEVALGSHDLLKAAQYYERATAVDKDNATARTRLGQVRLAAGDVDRALGDLETASESDAGKYQADLALISAHLRARDFDKALQAVAVLEKKQPNNPLTYNVKGIVQVNKRDVKGARASFAKAVELKPDYLPAVLNLAKLDIYEKNPQAARARFETIVAAQPKNEGALLGLAEVLAQSGAPAKEIVATIERAIAANTGSVSARVALVNYHLRNRDYKAAIDAAQAAVAIAPNDPRLVELLGNAQLAAGETNQAIATFNKLVSMRPDAPEPLVRLAGAQFAARDYPASIAALRKALAMKPDLVEVRRQIGVILAASGKMDEAFAEARAIQKDFPKQAAGFVLEADLYAAQKKWGAAANAFREAQKREPLPGVAVRQVTMLEEDGKPAEATAVATKWMKDNPKDVVMRSFLGERALRKKDYKEAMKYFKEVVDLQPENAIFLNNLAWTAHALGDPAALGYAEKAYSLAPGTPAVLDTYGWILLKKGDTKRAIELLSDAAGRAPKAAEIRLHLAQAYIADGNKAGAKKELEGIMQLGAELPQRAEAEQLLKKL